MWTTQEHGRKGHDDVRGLQRLDDTYSDAPFVDVVEGIPELKDVAGIHLCRIGGVQVQDDFLVGASVVDNLLKGAASQAIQNLNLACGFEETLGLVGKSPAKE
ncbi:MAG: hypothetical protein GY822_22835 [Deltaproteobacteria bacterium]|nr:hypothetical protein [Deltaproteobacteria bacterium]